MLIELKEISKSYNKKRKRIVALDNINLKVDKNKFTCIIGKSGAGKSTLLNILATIDKQTCGEYIFNGKPVLGNVNDLSLFRKENIGLVVQNFALINDMTIYNNIALPLIYDDFEKDIINLEVQKVAKQLLIEDKLKQYPTELSGGECQRVAIARAMIKKPKLLLADEPTGSLDAENKEIVLNLLKELQKMSTTVILATHDSSIYNKADRVVVLEKGKLMN